MHKRSEISDLTSSSRAVVTQKIEKTPRWKIALPIVVTVASCAWIAYLLFGGPSQAVILSPANTAATTILNNIGDREDLLETIQVRAEGDETNQVVRVTGTVKSKALLDELTSIVNGASAGAQVQMDVKVKP